MAGIDPRPPRPPQEDVENLQRPSFQPPLAGVSSTLIGTLQINLPTDFTDLEVTSKENHQGKPSVTFYQWEKNSLLKRLKHVLVAKFSHGRPDLEAIKHFFQKISGDINVSIYDSKHIIVECGQFTDFVQIWIKKVWIIKGFTVRFFKWDEKFHPSIESSTSPVWIHLPCLPLYFYEEWALLKIASVIGRPLFVDKNNINRNKLGYATICVEIDVANPLIDLIWIQFVEKGIPNNSEGFWQKIIYDFIPHHCSFCHHLGHKFEVCKRRLERGQVNGMHTHTSHFLRKAGSFGSKTHKTVGGPAKISFHNLEEGEFIEELEAGNMAGTKQGAIGVADSDSSPSFQDVSCELPEQMAGLLELTEEIPATAGNSVGGETAAQYVEVAGSSAVMVAEPAAGLVPVPTGHDKDIQSAGTRFAADACADQQTCGALFGNEIGINVAAKHVAAEKVKDYIEEKGLQQLHTLLESNIMNVDIQQTTSVDSSLVTPEGSIQDRFTSFSQQDGSPLGTNRDGFTPVISKSTKKNLEKAEKKKYKMATRHSTRRRRPKIFFDK